MSSPNSKLRIKLNSSVPSCTCFNMESCEGLGQAAVCELLSVSLPRAALPSAIRSCLWLLCWRKESERREGAGLVRAPLLPVGLRCPQQTLTAASPHGSFVDPLSFPWRTTWSCSPSRAGRLSAGCFQPTPLPQVHPAEITPLLGGSASQGLPLFQGNLHLRPAVGAGGQLPVWPLFFTLSRLRPCPP